VEPRCSIKTGSLEMTEQCVHVVGSPLQRAADGAPDPYDATQQGISSSHITISFTCTF